MKIILKFSCFMCCAFILTGCKKRDAEEIVLNTFEDWKQMNMDVWSDGPAMTGADTKVVIRDGMEVEYFRVDDPILSSLPDIKRATEEICTKNGAEKIYYDFYLDQLKMYHEEDGQLYILPMAIVDIYGGELKDFELLEEKENYIHARMEFSDSGNEVAYVIDIILIRENSKWKVDYLEQEFIDFP